jgi:putative transcriptional regulator
MSKRHLFSELEQSLTDAKSHNSGKMTLHVYHIDKPKKLSMKPAMIRSVRQHLNLSQSVFARLVRVSKRTLEKWEQGETHPNEQAVTLLLLVRKHPDLLDKLAALGG